MSPSSKRICLPEPTDKVTLRTLERLESLLIHDAAIEDQLVQAEAVADRYRQKRLMLQEKIFQYRAVIAPVRRIPTEVLAHIFKFIFNHTPDEIATMGMVCKAWRAAILFPTLWSHIVVIADHFWEKQKVLLFHERSARLPLHITFTQSLDVASKWRAWKVLMTSADRWSTLAVTFDDCKSAAACFTHLPPTPGLTELYVTIRRQCQSPLDETKYGFESWNEAHTPSLRSLYLTTFALPRPGAFFFRLTRLHILDTFADLINPLISYRPMPAKHILVLLSYCPVLEEFSLDAEKSVRWFVSNPLQPSEPPKLAMPTLRRLHLNCHHSTGLTLLTYLTAANIESANFHFMPRFDVQNDPIVGTAAAKFFIRSQAVRSLSLYAFTNAVILGGSIRSFGHLKELHLDHFLGLEVIAERFTTKQQSGNRPTPFWYSPQLTSLVITGNWFDVPFEKLKAFIKARYLENLSYGTPARIERYVVNGQDLLNGAAPGETIEYKLPKRFVRSPNGGWE